MRARPLLQRARRFLGFAGTLDPTRARPLVDAAGRFEAHLRSLDEDALRAHADRLRAAPGPLDPDTVTRLLALGREAARRTLGERAHDVQLLATAALLRGTVVEMATGEGKTLAGAMAAAAFALRGHRVHVLSVNDHLARRDADWMRPLHTLLGLTVDHVEQHFDHTRRRTAYTADITHVPAHEVGFDTLRDRLRTSPEHHVLPEPDVAIVDEADAVMIDEARIPLVLAGAVPGNDDAGQARRAVQDLLPERDYRISPDHSTVHLTDHGLTRAERTLGVDDLYAVGREDLLSRVNVALYAHTLLQRDVDYVVTDGRIHLIDTHRGRLAHRRRWPDGLHAAVEAREGLTPTEHGRILDQIIVQELLGSYPTLCGMTGTALQAAEEMREFYRLECGALPTHHPCIRTDEPDRLFARAGERDDAVIDLVVRTHATGRPVLVGTPDVAASERLGRRLRATGVPCQILNARDDTHEARVIAHAGQVGAVTVSTQMAGRGTDIRLGGPDGADHDRVAELGGLLVIGTHRHHTERLDRQLRGRAGRQGDPGTSVFFTSLEDELITRHAPSPTRPGPESDPDHPRARVRADHAQRVAEGALLHTHRTTWRYQQQLSLQRAEVLRRRHTLLTTGRPAALLREQDPDLWRERRTRVGEHVLAEAARTIVLYSLDERWSDHLAFTAELREGIHLRVLGRQSPLNAFHAETQHAFTGLWESALDEAAHLWRRAHITADGLDEASSGIHRPTATWTYMVHDNPFGTPEERFLEFLGGLVREAVRPGG